MTESTTTPELKSTKHETASGDATIYLMPDIFEPNYDLANLGSPFEVVYVLEVEGETFRLNVRRQRLTPARNPEQRVSYDLYRDDETAVGGRRWFKGIVKRTITDRGNVKVDVHAIFKHEQPALF